LIEGRTPARAARCTISVKAAVPDDARNGVSVANVGFVDGDILREVRDIGPLDRRIIEVVEVIEDRDGMAEMEHFSTKWEPMKPAPPVTRMRMIRETQEPLIRG
jgi:Ni,Fe-hydrogenase III component G